MKARHAIAAAFCVFALIGCGRGEPAPAAEVATDAVPAESEPSRESLKELLANHRPLLVTLFDLRINNKVGARGEVPPYLKWGQLGSVARVRNTGDVPLFIEVTRFAGRDDPLSPDRCQMRSQSHGFGKLRFEPRTSQDFGNAPFSSGIDCGEGDDTPLEFKVWDESDNLIWISESAVPEMLGISMSETLAMFSRLRPDGTLTD